MSFPSSPANPPSDSLYTPSARSSARFSAASGGSTASGSSGRVPQPLAHIKDLEDRSVESLNINQSISHLVQIAESSLRQAVTLLEYRKPDLAFLEYLRCYEVLVNFVCQSPGYPDFKARRGPDFSRYSHLIKVRQPSESDGTPLTLRAAPQKSRRAVRKREANHRK